MGASDTYQTIRYELADGIGTVTLNRPDRHNGITKTMMRELHEVLSTAFLDVAVAGDMGGPWTLPRIVGPAKAR